MVFVNGGTDSMYCDYADGTVMPETCIIKELIPYIDNNYRTVALREGRALEGFSMGGFGAVRFAFKYPQLFCAVRSFSGAFYDLKSISSMRPSIFAEVFSNWSELFQKDSPL